MAKHIDTGIVVDNSVNYSQNKVYHPFFVFLECYTKPDLFFFSFVQTSTLIIRAVNKKEEVVPEINKNFITK